GPPWLVSGFRFRARLGFSIPSTFSGPRGVTPAFGYGTPHSGARGTLTLLNNALLSAHYEPSRHRLVFSHFPGFRRLYEVPCSTGFPMGPGRFLQLLSMSLSPCCPYHPAGGGTTLRSGCVIPCCLRPYTEGSASGFFCVEATCGLILITSR